uniref:Apple domain-containing protein n=2 Tax=Emiliania huxleyi TaxID=2903 RepID=A0A7S3WKS8_EMIHU|mmetsp:Transcript_7362/g.21646  ORF Transcript_7362/g.21646 Transcript_7362/m.21646 type:complete len:736 (-) Transcript_7362:148-2355(-)
MHHADAGGGRRLTRRSFADAASRQLLCNDGSEAGFYLSEGDGSNSLVLLYQQSGGWCWDRASCDKRPEWYTGNSRWESTKAPGGIFDSALFAGATQVYLPYCSSDAWMSEMGFHANFSKWFRGRAIRDAAVDELVAAGLLGSAHRLVFAGVSAGGRGAMATIDSLGERLASLGMPPPFGVLDGVAYQDVPPLNSWTPLAEQCERVWRALQVEPPAHCTAQFPAREAWKCIMGTYALPRLASEFLAVTFLYDSYQLGNLGYMYGQVTAVDFAYAEWFRMLNEKTNADVYAAGNSAFGPACYEHGAGGDTWFSIKVGGVSADDMLRDALRGDYANVVDRHDHVDTNPTCPKFTEVAVSPPVEGARLHGEGGWCAGEPYSRLDAQAGIMSYSDCEAACFAADECAYFSSGNGFVGSSLPPALSSALAVASRVVDALSVQPPRGCLLFAAAPCDLVSGAPFSRLYATYARVSIVRGYTEVPASHCDSGLVLESAKGATFEECAATCDHRPGCTHLSYSDTPLSDPTPIFSRGQSTPFEPAGVRCLLFGACDPTSTSPGAFNTSYRLYAKGEHEFGLYHSGAQCDGGAEAETRVDTLESIETLHECRQLCAAEPECRFLSYSPGGGDGLGGRCLLHSACWRDRIIVEANFSVSWKAGHSASPADAAFSRERAARLWEEPHALLSQQPARVAAGPASSLPPFGMAGVAAGATAALAGLIFLASAARVRMSALGSRVQPQQH